MYYLLFNDVCVHTIGTLNGFGIWFPKGLLGVVTNLTDDSGLQRVTIRPGYSSGLNWVKGTVRTPLGGINVSWAVNTTTTRTSTGVTGGGVQLNVSIPVGTEASIWIPGQAGEVYETGLPAVKVKSLMYMGQDGDDSVWKVGSGLYAFTVQ